MRKRVITFAILLLTLTLDVRAGGDITPDKQAAANVGGLMRAYQITHDGRLPKNWDELTRSFNLSELNQTLQKRYGYRVEDRYEFVPQPIPMHDLVGAHVLLIRTVPLQSRKPMSNGEYQRYRYLVYQNPDKSIDCGWFTEEYVQQTLKEAGVTITPKPGLPEVEHDTVPLDYVPPAEGTTNSRKALSVDATSTTIVATATKPTSENNLPKLDPPVEIENRKNRGLVWLFAAVLALGGILFILRKFLR